jgi:hypothetical protein
LDGRRLFRRCGGVTPPCHPCRWRQTATSAGPDAAPKGGECFVEGAGDAWHVPVIDETAVELATQFAEKAGPVIVPGVLTERPT